MKNIIEKAKVWFEKTTPWAAIIGLWILISGILWMILEICSKGIITFLENWGFFEWFSGKFED